MSRGGATRLRVDGRELLAFCSNDYLGPRRSPARGRGVRRGRAPLGRRQRRVAPGERPLPRAPCARGGTRRLHAAAARAAVLDRLHGEPRRRHGAGSAAATGCIEDRLNHASLLDAGLASGARFARYPHGDVDALRAALGRAARRARTLVVTDGVFSMDGDVAPLRELAAACRAQRRAGCSWTTRTASACSARRARRRRGRRARCRRRADPDGHARQGRRHLRRVRRGLATTLIETLLQRARTYIYTTALPPAVAAATRAALRVMRGGAVATRARVLGHAARFRAEAAGLGLRAAAVATRRSSRCCSAASARRWRPATRCASAGLWVPAIRPPTVPAGTLAPAHHVLGGAHGCRRRSAARCAGRTAPAHRRSAAT